MPAETPDPRRLLRQLLETERAFGVQEIPIPGRPAPPAGGVVNKRDALAKLEAEFKNCTLCALSEKRTQVVFGAGNPDAELMFVGEAPGFDEDRQGEPFVGAAGQLLTKIIGAMKLRREDVYIANCLKCRPPGNRNPLPSEIATCKPILIRQIEIIQPRVVCALGKFAAQTLLQTDEPISRLRGRFFDWNGIKLLPTFHPAYLLRNPAEKKLVWEDVQKIMRELELC
ncbi:MAG: uracil-DNA glycosylase [Candidatus Omnitrophota bacterium]